MCRRRGRRGGTWRGPARWAPAPRTCHGSARVRQRRRRGAARPPARFITNRRFGGAAFGIGAPVVAVQAEAPERMDLRGEELVKEAVRYFMALIALCNRKDVT